MELSHADWQREIERLAPGLYRYFCGSFPGHSASDLVQETLIRLVQKHRAGSFQEARGDLKAFAYGLARMIRLEALRKQARIELVEDERDLEMPSAERTESDRSSHLRWAIRQLKPVEQEIILLLVDNEFPLGEIAAQLEIPLGTVKSHIHRAKERLKELMEVKA